MPRVLPPSQVWDLVLMRFGEVIQSYLRHYLRHQNYGPARLEGFELAKRSLQRTNTSQEISNAFLESRIEFHHWCLVLRRLGMTN